MWLCVCEPHHGTQQGDREKRIRREKKNPRLLKCKLIVQVHHKSPMIKVIATNAARATNKLQVRFSQKGSKSLSKFTSGNLKNKWIENGCPCLSALLGFISDFQRVCTSPKNPVDVRNEPQQGTCSQAIYSSNFLM